MNSVKMKMELQMIKSRADILLKESEYAAWGAIDLENSNEPEEERLFMEEQFNDILCSLDEICSKINYLNGKIVCEGKLEVNANDRYCCGGYELCCGYGMEILFFDEWKDSYRWAATRLEHNGSRYYAVGYPEQELLGIRVRIRRSDR